MKKGRILKRKNRSFLFMFHSHFLYRHSNTPHEEISRDVMTIIVSPNGLSCKALGTFIP